MNTRFLRRKPYIRKPYIRNKINRTNYAKYLLLGGAGALGTYELINGIPNAQRYYTDSINEVSQTKNNIIDAFNKTFKTLKYILFGIALLIVLFIVGYLYVYYFET